MKEILPAMPKESWGAVRMAIGILINSAYYATEPTREDRKYVQEIINKSEPEVFLHYKKTMPWYITIGLQPNRLLI